MIGPGMDAVLQHALVSIHVALISTVTCNVPDRGWLARYLALSVHLKPFLIADHMFHIRVPGLEAPKVSLLNLFK